MSLLHNSIIFFYLISTLFYFVYLFAPKNYMQKMGLSFLWVGFLLNLFKIFITFKEIGFLIAYDFSIVLNIAACSIAGIFIFLRYKTKLKILGVAAMPIATILMILSTKGTMAQATAGNASFLKSIWIVIHIMLIFIGDAFLAIAFGVSILFLIQEKSIKSKKNMFFFRRLPSLSSLDNISEYSTKLGFAFLTCGLIIGIIYAKIIWGSFFRLDVKEIFSAITWLTYAIILHGRLITGLRGKKASIITIIAFGILLFTFFGVNFFMQGHHSEFTKF